MLRSNRNPCSTMHKRRTLLTMSFPQAGTDLTIRIILKIGVYKKDLSHSSADLDMFGSVGQCQALVNYADWELLTLSSTFGSSVYAPGFPGVMKQFNVSSTASLIPLALYVYGLGFGPVIAAPLSETYGRRVVYLVSLPASLLFTLGAGLAQSFGTLLVCRFLAGTLGSPCLAVAAGTSLDLWEPIHLAKASSIFLMTVFLGPALGPAVGGFAADPLASGDDHPAAA